MDLASLFSFLDKTIKKIKVEKLKKSRAKERQRDKMEPLRNAHTKQIETEIKIIYSLCMYMGSESCGGRPCHKSKIYIEIILTEISDMYI